MSKVYLVEDVGNCPGRIWGVFSHHALATSYAALVADEQNTECKVEIREVHSKLRDNQSGFGGQLP